MNYCCTLESMVGIWKISAKKRLINLHRYFYSTQYSSVIDEDKFSTIYKVKKWLKYITKIAWHLFENSNVFLIDQPQCNPQPNCNHILRNHSTRILLLTVEIIHGWLKIIITNYKESLLISIHFLIIWLFYIFIRKWKPPFRNRITGSVPTWQNAIKLHNVWKEYIL